MAEKLKDQFLQPRDIERFAAGLAAAWPDFDKSAFVAAVLDDEWDKRELKQRMRHLALCMGPALPDYARALEILRASVQHTGGFFGIVLSEYVECFGLEAPELSLPALREFTRHGSAEFAVRPFLVLYPEQTLAAMLEWTEDDNEHVRRLASEGCRPRLPWAPALPRFKSDPAPILPILERLKSDPSEYVRRSVANNLNDIAKDHPELVLEIAERWLLGDPGTAKLVKHACRTLLRAGDARALRLFGFADPARFEVKNLLLNARALPIGATLHFSFRVQNNDDQTCQVRLEYRIDYMKANGKQSPKVFQISESSMAPGQREIQRKQSLRNMSTRKHHPGRHGLAILVNGVQKARTSFELLPPS